MLRRCRGSSRSEARSQHLGRLADPCSPSRKHSQNLQAFTTSGKNQQPAENKCRRSLLSFANITSRQNHVDGWPVAGHSTRDPSHLQIFGAIRLGWSTRRDLLLETLTLRHQLASSPARIDAFAQLTVCSGRSCDAFEELVAQRSQRVVHGTLPTL